MGKLNYRVVRRAAEPKDVREYQARLKQALQEMEVKPGEEFIVIPAKDFAKPEPSAEGEG